MTDQKESFNDKVVFITGNSRSGTTVMMRIMSNHSLLHSINEPHFFEKLWYPADEGNSIDQREAENLYAKLLVSQREGFFESVEKNKSKYESEYKKVDKFCDGHLTRLSVYRMFMIREASLNGKIIPCEKTPQNVFYIHELLKFFPNARVINMIRDPRGVLLSQKRKWKRRKLGADFITPKEVLRLRVNYHPITISKLWNAAVSAAEAYKDDPRVKNVRFEDLVQSPEPTMAEITSFLNIDFEKSMLMVPHAGSSTEADNKRKLGIKKSRAMGWQEKGLSATEIAICQDLCESNMQEYHYEIIDVKASSVMKSWQYLIVLPKLFFALLLNLNRMRSIGNSLKRRFKPT